MCVNTTIINDQGQKTVPSYVANCCFTTVCLLNSNNSSEDSATPVPMNSSSHHMSVRLPRHAHYAMLIISHHIFSTATEIFLQNQSTPCFPRKWTHCSGSVRICYARTNPEHIKDIYWMAAFRLCFGLFTQFTCALWCCGMVVGRIQPDLRTSA